MMRQLREFMSDLFSGVGASTALLGLVLMGLFLVGAIPFHSSYGGILPFLLLPAFILVGVGLVLLARVLDSQPALPPLAGGGLGSDEGGEEDPGGESA